MKKREPVSHIMTSSVISLELNQNSLHDAKNIFNKEGIRHLPVTDHGKLCGIISKNDINRLSFGTLFEGQGDADEAVFDMLSVEQVMTANPRVIDTETSIKEVAEIFAKEDFHSLPVVEGDEIKGIVTSTDIIKYLLDQY
jgi:CBS domain-containing protein